jgi:hypothetical protein
MVLLIVEFPIDLEDDDGVNPLHRSPSCTDTAGLDTSVYIVVMHVRGGCHRSPSETCLMSRLSSLLLLLGADTLSSSV